MAQGGWLWPQTYKNWKGENSTEIQKKKPNNVYKRKTHLNNAKLGNNSAYKNLNYIKKTRTHYTINIVLKLKSESVDLCCGSIWGSSHALSNDPTALNWPNLWQNAPFVIPTTRHLNQNERKRVLLLSPHLSKIGRGGKVVLTKLDPVVGPPQNCLLGDNQI